MPAEPVRNGSGNDGRWNERTEGLRRQPARQTLDACVRLHISSPALFMTGRTSTPKYFASGIWAARSMARSALSQSTT